MTANEQRRAALAIGNSVRTEQAALRREIADAGSQGGRILAATILRNPTASQSRMRCGHLVRAIPRFGPARAGKLIRRCGLAPGRFDRTIGDLSPREREAIADHLENPGGSVVTNEFTRSELALIREIARDLAVRVPERERVLREIASKCEAMA